MASEKCNLNECERIDKGAELCVDCPYREENRETRADIIAEMRAWTADDHADPCEVSLNVSAFADRLEAAAKREDGNAAKMREALEFCIKQMSDATCDKDFGDDVVYLVGCMKTCIDFMKHALAAPPRNCDRYATAVEAMEELKRVHSWCAKENRRCLEDCPDCGKTWCSLAWLFAAAEEGVSNE